MALKRSRMQIRDAVHAGLALHPEIAVALVASENMEWLLDACCSPIELTDLAADRLLNDGRSEAVIATKRIAGRRPSRSSRETFERLWMWRRSPRALDLTDAEAISYLEALEQCNVDGDATVVTYQVWFNDEPRAALLIQPHHLLGHVGTCPNAAQAQNAMACWRQLDPALGGHKKPRAELVVRFVDRHVESF